MHADQVQGDPQPAGRHLCRRQCRAVAHLVHQPREQRVPLDGGAVKAHPHIGKDAVARLGNEEGDHH
jgi:hypothetical protein